MLIRYRVSLVTLVLLHNKKFSTVFDHGVAHSTNCESGLKKSTHLLLSTQPMRRSKVPSREPKEKGAIAPGSAQIHYKSMTGLKEEKKKKSITNSKKKKKKKYCKYICKVIGKKGNICKRF